jgi:hypothetical protein
MQLTYPGLLKFECAFGRAFRGYAKHVGNQLKAIVDLSVKNNN